MAQTTSTGAKKIQGTDDWRDIFDDHNDTVDAYDGLIGTTSLPTTAQTLTGAIAEHESDISSHSEAIANLQDGLAIVATGNTHAAIPAGAFVYVKNHNTLSDGLYTNKSGATIAANDTLTSSNLQAESSGGFNVLNNNLTNKFVWEDVTCGTPSSGTLIHFDGKKNNALKLVYINCQINGASAGATLSLNNIGVFNSHTVQVYGYNAYNNTIANITIWPNGVIEFTEGGALVRFTAVFMCG